MRHLEFVTQCLHPDWNVRIMSVTEQWAQFAVAGPQSRALLNGFLETPIDNESWPFMACGPVRLGGVDGRLFRISFSGEHAYEVAVPARFGAALFERLVDRAEAMGGGAYGMEALNVLRIEKGFITHAEIHGRTTAFDIGMDRMVSAKKDSIGRVMSRRPGLLETDREQLAGFKPVGAIKRLTAGAHLYPEGANATPDADQGYLTSVVFSPSFGHYIGLGFVRGGAARHGERLRLVDAVRGIDTVVEVCDPVFIDQAGERAGG
jgi:sarcosine oxidase subunit alpha